MNVPSLSPPTASGRTLPIAFYAVSAIFSRPSDNVPAVYFNALLTVPRIPSVLNF
nr:MAG TPA: hypothetical protein [Bacteriophage sp.]